MCWVTGTEKDNEFSPTGKTSQHFGVVSVRVGSGHAVTRGGVSKQVLKVLNSEQKNKLKQYVSVQKPKMTLFLEKRFELTKELRNLLEKGEVDSNKVIQISRDMGQLEGEMTLSQAELYVELRETFTQDQIAMFFEMRATYLPSTKQKKSNSENAIERGEKIFALCAMCHSVKKGENLVGPSLYQIIDKPSGEQANYNYSHAMDSKHIKWTLKNLDNFLENPKKIVPGTSMPFTGIENKSDRKALLEYLETFQ
ncbi:c-type cytochrome [Flavicella sp.]|uniref:c-type cytochrome n=1 Tax=Flavicella sp. TaxID=2957742 RepID=UPI00262A14D2|nr:c-type cytochrome [Flavicella sp.]MDG1805944.1 c-type cytochrome [Flavicella sp.]